MKDDCTGIRLFGLSLVSLIVALHKPLNFITLSFFEFKMEIIICLPYE